MFFKKGDTLGNMDCVGDATGTNLFVNAKEMFEKLGYEYDFIKNKNCEDYITYHKDNLHIQFNLISKLVVLQNDTSYIYYNSAIFMINNELLRAINQQCKELGWD